VKAELQESESQDRLLDALCGATEVLEELKPDRSAHQKRSIGV
jgi:hypothetical protein